MYPPENPNLRGIQVAAGEKWMLPVYCERPRRTCVESFSGGFTTVGGIIGSVGLGELISTVCEGSSGKVCEGISVVAAMAENAKTKIIEIKICRTGASVPTKVIQA